MAGANMKDIKRRIKSVESTMQITKAMELVASSKLRRAKERADRAHPYFNTLYDTMYEIFSTSPEVSTRFTHAREEKNVLLIVIAGDRGLAGGFNSNVLRMAYNYGRELAAKGVTVKVCAIGKKAVEFFQKREFEVTDSYIGVAEAMHIYMAADMAEKIVGRYSKRMYDRVELFYTTFISALTQVPQQITMLPVDISKDTKPVAAGEKTAHEMTIYEPSAEAVFNAIIPKYVSGLLYGSIVDSFAAEQASRRTAMESASDNAGDMIDGLSLLYNRARQAAITQEISEIVSGSLAQR